MVNFAQPTMAQLAAIEAKLADLASRPQTGRTQYATAAEYLEASHASWLTAMTFAPGNDRDAYRKAVLNRCVQSFAAKSPEVQLQVLTLFGCADLAGLSSQRIAEFFAGQGLAKFYSLSTDAQNQVMTLLLPEPEPA